MARRILLGLCLVVLVGALLILWFTYSQTGSEPTVTLPDAVQIKSISAKIYESSWGTPVPEYEVPPDYFPTILSAMTPAQREDSRWFIGFGAIGHLTIITKDGEKTEIEIFPAGINPVCVSINGVSCMRGGRFESSNPKVTNANWHADESVLFVAILAEIYRVHVQQKSSERLERYIDKLKISRGEKPPP